MSHAGELFAVNVDSSPDEATVRNVKVGSLANVRQAVYRTAHRCIVAGMDTATRTATAATLETLVAQLIAEVADRIDFHQLKEQSARIDEVVSDNLLADMKTSRDAADFEKAVLNYGYDRQAAFYLNGWRAVTGRFTQFAFAAIESEAPHEERAAPASAGVIVSGRRKYQEVLRVVAALKTREVPARYEQPNELDLPLWKRRQHLTFTVCGESVEIFS